MTDRGSLRARVTATAALLVLALLSVGGVVFVAVLDAQLTAGQHALAAEQAEVLADRIEAGTDAAGLLRDEESIVQVVRDGGIVAASEGAMEDVEGALPVDDGARVTIDDEPHIVATVDSDAGEVVVARSLEPVGEAVAATVGLLAVAIPLLDVLLGALVWVLVGRALRPVERLRADVAAIGPDDLSRRVAAPHGASELRELAATMNGLLGRVESAQQRERRFLADASHELRSPIATLQQHGEVAAAHPDATTLPDLADVVRAEASRLAELVDSMLVLARSGEAAAERREDVDLDDLVLSEATRLRAFGDVAVTVQVAPARISGDPAQLARVLRNLADNARRHARSAIRLELGVDGAAAVLRVDDDGSGIPASERQRVFERFVRLDEARSRDAGGAGLGLAIVAELVARHGGSVTAGDSPTGGARFEVRLPRA